MNSGGYFFALVFDPEGERLLFGGKDGQVGFLDMVTGRSGVLLEPPGRPPIIALELSRDRSVLCCTCDPDMFAHGNDRRGPVLQFWNYPELCRKTEGAS